MSFMLVTTLLSAVQYARTHSFSYMGVQYPGTVSTEVDVPGNTETGTTSMEVIANGIPSPAVTVTIQ
jgi:hypothetical protein